ncbi:MAG: hypothetical protein Fur0037_13410 [Planctomycetota bacterium]
MTARVVLSLQGPMDHLRLVWQTGEALIEGMVFDADEQAGRYNVLLALQEMVTNVLRHAYRHDQRNRIEVSFEVDRRGFKVELRDQGPEFDPLAHDTSFLEDSDCMPLETGGYGIYIAKMVMDRVAYRREGGWNVLTMEKTAAAAVPTGVE